MEFYSKIKSTISIKEKRFFQNNIDTIDYNKIYDEKLQWGFLHKSIKLRNIWLVKYILRYKKLDINRGDIHAKTALHYAVINGDIKIVEFLLRKEAKTDLQDEKGNTALHYAIKYYHRGIIRLLLFSQALTDIENEVGETCFDLMIKKLPDMAYYSLQYKNSIGNRKNGIIGTVSETLPVTVNSSTEGTNGVIVSYDYHELDNELFQYIVHNEQIDIINHPWMVHYLNYQWKTFAKPFFNKSMFLYIFYLLIFTLVSILYRIDTTNVDNIFFKGLILALYFCNTYYIGKECLELKRGGSINYCSTIWNYFDIVQYLLVFTFLPLKFYDSSYQWVVLSLLGPIFWIKFLHFARGFKTIGPFVRMLFKMIGDISHFLILFSIFLLGYSHGFYMLLGDTVDEYSTIQRTIMSLFNLNLGDYDYEVFYDTSFKLTSHILFISFTVISVIVLMNLLIAIMGDSYSAINEKAEKEWRLELAKLILHMQTLYDPTHKQIKSINVLYVLEEDCEYTDNQIKRICGRIKLSLQKRQLN